MKDKELEDIIEDIRELRDADFHVCSHSEWQSKGEPDTDEDITCSCEEFDKVIDKLRMFLSPKSIERVWGQMKDKKLKTYNVYQTYTITDKYFKVRAKNRDEAVQKAVCGGYVDQNDFYGDTETTVELYSKNKS